MSETATTTTPEGSVPAEGVTVPEGFVPAAEVEAAREEARRRYQGELDRTKAELSRLQSAPAPAAAASTPKEAGSDLSAFRAELLRDVSGVISMTQSATELRAAFPHADASLFTPDRLAQFSNPDALRLAVEDSHARVAAILDAERAKLREELVAEFTEKYGGAASSGSGATAGVPGDPTPQQLAAMPLDEFNRLDPEVVARVLAANA